MLPIAHKKIIFESNSRHEGELWVLDENTLKPIGKINTDFKALDDMIEIKGHDMFAVATTDLEIEIRAVSDPRKILGKLVKHAARIRRMIYIAERHQIVSCDHSSRIIVWDLAKMSLVSNTQYNLFPIVDIVYADERLFFICMFYGWTVFSIDPRINDRNNVRGTCCNQPDGDLAQIIDAGNSMLVVMTWTGAIITFDTKTGNLTSIINNNAESSAPIMALPNENLVFYSKDKQIVTIDPASGNTVSEVPFESFPTDFIVSSEGSLIVKDNHYRITRCQ